MNYVGHFFDLPTRFSCSENPRHFSCKLNLDKRKPSEWLPNKFQPRAESQTEVLTAFLKVWPPCVLGDFFGSVIADFRSEGRDQHEGIVDVAIELLAVDCDAADAMFDEAVAGVGEQFHGVQIIKNHHRLEDV